MSEFVDAVDAFSEEEIENRKQEKKKEDNKKKKEERKRKRRKELKENKKKEEDEFKLFEEEAKKEMVELMEKKRAKILENVKKAKAAAVKNEHDALLQSFIDDDSMEEKNLIEREKKIRADLKAEKQSHRDYGMSLADPEKYFDLLSERLTTLTEVQGEFNSCLATWQKLNAIMQRSKAEQKSFAVYCCI